MTNLLAGVDFDVTYCDDMIVVNTVGVLVFVVLFVGVAVDALVVEIVVVESVVVEGVVVEGVVVDGVVVDGVVVDGVVVDGVVVDSVAVEAVAVEAVAVGTSKSTKRQCTIHTTIQTTQIIDKLQTFTRQKGDVIKRNVITLISLNA